MDSTTTVSHPLTVVVVASDAVEGGCVLRDAFCLGFIARVWHGSAEVSTHVSVFVCGFLWVCLGMLLVVGTMGNTVVLEHTTIEVCTGGSSSGLLRFPIVRRVFPLQPPPLCGLFRATGGGRGCDWVQVCVCGCCLFVFFSVSCVCTRLHLPGSACRLWPDHMVTVNRGKFGKKRYEDSWAPFGPPVVIVFRGFGKRGLPRSSTAHWWRLTVRERRASEREARQLGLGEDDETRAVKLEIWWVLPTDEDVLY